MTIQPLTIQPLTIQPLTIQQRISQLASQCVLCGLCIPYCPTYMIFRTENESPRGRISLFKALAEEQFAVPFSASKALLTSLDHCLSCRACEKMCPSQVDYATISSLGRELINRQFPQHQRPIRQQLAEKILMTPSIHPLLKLSAKAMASLQPLTGGFSHEIAMDSAHGSPLQDYYPAAKDSSESKQQVILFKGCSTDLFEQQTMNDAIILLNACQFDVFIPDKQQCCGAISNRQGDSQQLRTLAQQNIDYFVDLLQKSQAIISITNSCSGQLKGYNKLTGISGAKEFSPKVSDIIGFLAQAIKTANLKFKPLAEDIGVHIPCSLKNVLKEEALLFNLLANIPDIRLIKITDQYCCGAAGSYMLQYPEIAQRLLKDKIDDISQQNYQTIVSSNISCSLHFKQGLKKYGQKQSNKISRTIEILHPISLLARQLITSPLTSPK